MPWPLGMGVRPQKSFNHLRRCYEEASLPTPQNYFLVEEGWDGFMTHSYPGMQPGAANLMPSAMTYRSCADSWRKRCC